MSWVLFQGLLSGVPRGRLILLDLYAEVFPIWLRTASFYGIPFIWCMLHNFGGNTGAGCNTKAELHIYCADAAGAISCCCDPGRCTSLAQQDGCEPLSPCAGMYAALPHVVEGWATATMCSPPSSVVGTGLCMEGIEQNPLVYDLMAELAFRWLWVASLSDEAVHGSS
jgi:alpha-N-acetylglucosaminidase